MMVELYSLDDVGQGYDIAQGNEGQVAVTMGRHSGDYMTSFYILIPSGFMTEYGWGGRSVDHATWKAFERPMGRASGATTARGCRRRSARGARDAHEGRRRRPAPPVQVIEGNYNLMPGACPWWDGMKQQKAG